VLNVALALAAMTGTVIPQMQPGIQNFDTELNTFLDAARGRYGDLSGFLYWAGFFDLYNSLWFRMLVVLVIFSIIMCTLNRWGPIMRLIRQPAVRVSESFTDSLTERAQFRPYLSTPNLLRRRCVPLSTRAAIACWLNMPTTAAQSTSMPTVTVGRNS